MSSVIDSATDVVSDVIGAGGNIVQGGVDILGNVVEAGGDFIDETGKVVSDLDFEDAAKTFVMTGGNPYAAAFAATSADEDLGFNPAVFYDPSSGGFGFADPDIYSGFVQGDLPKEFEGIFDYPGKNIIEPFATQAITSFAKSALEQDQPTQEQFAGLANLTLEGLEGLQGMISAGEFEKAPSLSFFPVEQPQSNILSRYDQAKANLNNIMRPEGLVDMPGRLGIFENYFEQRGLI